MIYRKRPKKFDQQFELVSCYVEHRGRILVLRRLSQKAQGGRWGLPAGKINPGEKRLAAMVREIREETGIRFRSAQLRYLARVYVKHPQCHFIKHMYRVALPRRVAIALSASEHDSFRWCTPTQALRLPLIKDLDRCITMFY